MKRFLKALPLILAGGLALTGCGSVEVGVNVHNQETASVTVHAEATQEEVDAYVKEAGGDPSTTGYYTPGYVIQSYLGNYRQGLGSIDGVKVTEDTSGKNLSATWTVDGVALSALPTAALGLAVTYDQDRYTVSVERPADDTLPAGMPATLSVTFPQAVGEVTGGGEASGNTVTWHLDKIAAGESLSAITVGPGMNWWISSLLFVGGLIVTVLLVVIALQPSRRKEKGEIEV